MKITMKSERERARAFYIQSLVNCDIHCDNCDIHCFNEEEIEETILTSNGAWRRLESLLNNRYNFFFKEASFLA